MKPLELWLPPDGAGAPVGCVATSFTFDAAFFDTDCLARFLGLTAAFGEGDRASDVSLMIETEERLAEASVSVLVDRPAVLGPQGVLEQGVDRGREHHAARPLAVVGERLVVRHRLRRGHVVGLGGPVEPGALGPRCLAGAPRFGPADQPGVRGAGGDLRAGPVQQGLRVVAAVVRGDGPAWFDAELRGHEAPRVGVAVGEDVDDRHGVDGAQEAVGAAVRLGGPSGLGEQRDRLQRGGQVGGPLLHLADGHDHRGARVECGLTLRHGCSSSAMRRSQSTT